MKCNAIRVRWNHDWSNDPGLEILVDKLDWDGLVYKRKDNLYFAERDGLVSFYYYASPGEGFGGRSYELTLDDGTKTTLIGPWSSAPSTMNAAGFAPCVDAAITDEPRVWAVGYTFFGGNVTLAFAQDALAHLLPEVEMKQVGSLWIPHSVVGCMKSEGNKARYECPICHPEAHHHARTNHHISQCSDEQTKAICS